MTKMKTYDERIRELEDEVDCVVSKCENRVLDLRGKLRAVKGLKKASTSQNEDKEKRWQLQSVTSKKYTITGVLRKEEKQE